MRAAATGAVTLAVIYVACWVGTQISTLTVSHMFLALFTQAPVNSTAALTIGLGWALIFGAFSGALIAFLDSVFANLGRRPL